ncbi:MAG: hypothetical protein B6D58_04015 [candidate division Zixibacteria bacterium 4484_95]|nr:MAG: hypothetical protein B6D58_04015 [candidate division Zixibacteria bacterium 4484_95]
MCTELDQHIKNKILLILKKSPIPEDYEHALNVLKWVENLKPDSDIALQVAALGHDIERALPVEKVKRVDFASYDDFKRAHSENSARIMQKLLSEYPIPRNIIEKVVYLITYHEIGKDGDLDLNILKDADSLSFFEVNLPHYFNREGLRETYSRMLWGYRRLSEGAKVYLKNFHYNKDILNRFLKIVRSK